MRQILKEPVPLTDVLHTFFQDSLDNNLSNDTDQGIEIKIWQNWPKFAKTEILKCAKPVNYQKGRLILWVANSVELQELSFHIENLKQAINQHFKKNWIKDIYFTLNQELLQRKEKSFKFLKKISSNKL